MKTLTTALSALLLLSLTPAAFGQYTSTETTTTTTSSDPDLEPAFTLPAGLKYVVVNPESSTIVGPFVAGQAITPGFFLVDESSGQVMATVDKKGRLVALTTIPSPLSEHFVVTDGKLIYQKTVATTTTTTPVATATTTTTRATPVIVPTTVLVSDYAARRLQLQEKVSNEYAAGRLTHNQTEDLRDELASIASIEMKRKADGTYSKSNIKRMEKKLAAVQDDFSNYLADTKTKKARIGIRVDD